MVTYFMVEQLSRDFSCPVSFKTEEDAMTAARRWKTEGAFRVTVYRMETGAPSGVVIAVL